MYACMPSPCLVSPVSARGKHFAGRKRLERGHKGCCIILRSWKSAQEEQATVKGQMEHVSTAPDRVWGEDPVCIEGWALMSVCVLFIQQCIFLRRSTERHARPPTPPGYDVAARSLLPSSCCFVRPGFCRCRHVVQILTLLGLLRRPSPRTLPPLLLLPPLLSRLPRCPPPR